MEKIKVVWIGFLRFFFPQDFQRALQRATQSFKLNFELAVFRFERVKLKRCNHTRLNLKEILIGDKKEVLINSIFISVS